LIVTAQCPHCGAIVERDIRMMPKFLAYKLTCTECGGKVPVEYDPGMKPKGAALA